MGLKRITLQQKQCKKCEHIWWPKPEQPAGPKRCPKCCNDWRTGWKNKSKQVPQND